MSIISSSNRETTVGQNIQIHIFILDNDLAAGICANSLEFEHKTVRTVRDWHECQWHSSYIAAFENAIPFSAWPSPYRRTCDRRMAKQVFISLPSANIHSVGHYKRTKIYFRSSWSRCWCSRICNDGPVSGATQAHKHTCTQRTIYNGNLCMARCVSEYTILKSGPPRCIVCSPKNVRKR